MTDATSNIVSLYSSNFQDVAATLREIADQVERGEFGEVESAGLVLLGDTLEVFGFGPKSDGLTTGMILHAALGRISRAIEDHGR